MKQSPLLEFDSSFFPVIPGEDEDTNPGIYGKTLACWLVEKLRLHGFPAEDALAEDFGWFIPIRSKPHRLQIICANIEGRSDHWGIFAAAKGGWAVRLIGRDRRVQMLSDVMAAIRGALENAGIAENFQETE